MGTLDEEFTATPVTSPNKGGWTDVVRSDIAERVGTRGLVEVRGNRR